MCPAWVTPGDLCTWCQGLFWALQRSDGTFWSKKWRRRAHSWHTSSFTLLLASKGQYFKISRCLCHVCLSMFQCFYQPGLDSIFTEIKFQLGFILLACQVQSLAADLKKFQDRNFLSWESPKYSMKLEIFWSKEIRAKRQTVDITCTEHAKVPSGSLAKGIKYKKQQKYCGKVPSWICILHHLTISDPSLSLPSLLEITGHSTEHCHSRTLQGVWPKIDNLQSLKLVVLSTSATKASWMEVVEHLNHFANCSTKTSRNKLAFNENTFEAFESHPFHSV